MLYNDYELFFHPNHGMLRVVTVTNSVNNNNNTTTIDIIDQTCTFTSYDGDGTCSSSDSTSTTMTTLLLQQLRLLLPFEFDNNNKNNVISPNSNNIPNLLSLMQYTTTMEQRWWLFWFGFLNILLVFVGIWPRLNLLFWHINYCSIMYNSSDYIADGTETGIVPLTKLMNFYFMLLPLDNITIYDGFGFGRRRGLFLSLFFFGTKKNDDDQKGQNLTNDDYNDDREVKNQIMVGNNNDDKDTPVADTVAATTTTTSSWPMWPVFLVQWQTVLIMVGAGLAKWTGADKTRPISSSHWVDGTSM